MDRPDLSATLHRLRTLLLFLVAFGAFGLLLELLLLEHWGEWNQWVPLVLLTGTVVGSLVLALRPGPVAIRVFRAVMIAAVLSGIVGAGLHFRANAALELEIDPALALGRLVRAALGGGVPTLAPGAMIQLGLLGLIATFRHPAAAPAANSTLPSKNRP